MAEPTGLIAKSGLELLTHGTPNGYKPTILLEELKAAYGLQYTYQSIPIRKNIQKQPWFTSLNPNGRIPVLVDHDRPLQPPVFEGLAILSYLARHYDPDHLFSFAPATPEHAEVESWMAWQHGGLGPMQGQAEHFTVFARDVVPYGIYRYIAETERLYGILDARLSSSSSPSNSSSFPSSSSSSPSSNSASSPPSPSPPRDYIVGNKFTIADICLLGWVNAATITGLDLPAQFPHVFAWLRRCLDRPAVASGFTIPERPTWTNEVVETDPGKWALVVERRELIRRAKETFGYQYSSP
ncbi:glutathione S-transferase [Xylaria sp. CBS 124048]|nr:glutathione S-transferase [Xylaria sp. CBS 124048]